MKHGWRFGDIVSDVVDDSRGESRIYSDLLYMVVSDSTEYEDEVDMVCLQTTNKEYVEVGAMATGRPENLRRRE